MHYLAKQLSDKKWSVIQKAIILTGCDYTSKIDTASGALHCPPEEYSLNIVDEYQTLKVKNKKIYFVELYTTTRRAESFNKQRAEQHVEKSYSLLKLAPIFYATTDIWKDANCLLVWIHFFHLVLVKTLPILNGKRKMVHFYVKSLNVTCQNTSRPVADVQLNVWNDIYISNMKLFSLNSVLANETVTIFENQIKLYYRKWKVFKLYIITANFLLTGKPDSQESLYK